MPIDEKVSAKQAPAVLAPNALMYRPGAVRGGRGYLMIDNRASGGKLEEYPTLTCAHCNVIVVLRAERTRERGYCARCHAYICDDQVCATYCAPVLQCVDERGGPVNVESLSDGARDQLYLALRLASLERFAERNEPMPLVLDDVLIHFDEERAGAALAVLGEFSAVTQVLFFTHNARMIDQARAAIPVERLFTHALHHEGRHAPPD